MLTFLVQNRPINLGPGFEPPSDAFNPGTGTDVDPARIQLELILSNVLGVITVLVGLGFILFLVFGAMQWITAGGDDGKISQARQQIMNAGLGLVATMVAWSIMVIVSRVLGIPFLDLNQALIELNPL